MDILEYVQFYISAFISFFIAPSHPYHEAVLYGVISLLLMFMVRTLFITITRSTGLYHIDHYAHWPRLPWRFFWNLWMVIYDWWQEVFTFGKRSTAGFTNVLSMFSLLYRKGMIPLGRAYALGFGLLMPVGIKTKRHLMIVAMTGSGKTVFLTLLVRLWRSSVFLIDPKGSVTRSLSRLSKKKWHILAPYDKDISNASWNFFDEIKDFEKRYGADSVVGLVEKICEALIIKLPTENNPFFPSSARGFASAIILHLRSAFPEEDHNPVFMYQLITRGYWHKSSNAKIAFDLLLDDMLGSTAYNGAIASRVTAIADAGETTRGNVLSTLRDQIKWLSLPEVAPLITSSSFLCSELKYRDDIVVSLAAPVSDLRGHLAPFSRLLTNILSYNFERITGAKKYPCLFAVDEMQAQGYNEYVEQTVPLMRGHGVQFIGIVQDLEGLKKAYPHSWEGFLGNADAVIWMASNHLGTNEYLSRVLGKTTRSQKIKGTSRRVENERELMTPEQVGRFLEAEKENIIVTRAGTRPLKLKLLKYYSDLPVTDYDSDPDHGEVLLRRLTRFILARLNTENPKETNSS
ncbi:MAG: hypothetical protein COA45_05880 [Zetaproteobacteria bacterium]|nr:MAG: hypothetical protein COA45_05880 [Zetaproteobacteria bacterium]